jgi:hypothetical protein
VCTAKTRKHAITQVPKTLQIGAAIEFIYVTLTLHTTVCVDVAERVVRRSWARGEP